MLHDLSFSETISHYYLRHSAMGKVFFTMLCKCATRSLLQREGCHTFLVALFPLFKTFLPVSCLLFHKNSRWLAVLLEMIIRLTSPLLSIFDWRKSEGKRDESCPTKFIYLPSVISHSSFMLTICCKRKPLINPTIQIIVMKYIAALKSFLS